jgi:hypothetical protein
MTPGELADLAVDACAAARLTRLLTADTLPPLSAAREKAHDAVARRHGPAWADGLRCPWCAGMWVAAAVHLARHRLAGWPQAARLLAVAHLAGLLQSDT